MHTLRQKQYLTIRRQQCTIKYGHLVVAMMHFDLTVAIQRFHASLFWQQLFTSANIQPDIIEAIRYLWLRQRIRIGLL
jgi:hypothetical protein